jgi:hypothetical protein
MTWTFLEDYTKVRDQIRVMIGDVVASDPLLSDEAIAFFYGRGGSVLAGAILAARAATAKLALEFDKDLDGLKTNRSQRHKAMLDTIAQLEAEQAQGSFKFIAPAIGKIADSTKYPKSFEPSDLAAPGWDEE